MASDWRRRKKQELQRRLYEAALHLFETDGYDRTTVQQITERVGVAKGTFFNHFPTKEHVIAEWYNGLTFESLEAARGRDHASAEEAVCGLFVDMVQRAVDSSALLIAKSRNSSHPLLVAAEQTQDDETDAFVFEQCVAGKARGELATDLDERFFVGLLGDVLTGTSRAWVSTLPRFDFPVVIRQRILFLFRAARPERS